MGIFNKIKGVMSSNKNFEYLDKLIHSGSKEIKLEYNINLDFDEIDEYAEGILLDVDDLVIDGNGHTINARGETRIFSVTGKNITLKNITLKNGCAKEVEEGLKTQNGMFIETKKNRLWKNKITYGGAIFNTGILNIIESTVQENTANKCGGAIYNEGELTVADTTLKENTAEKDGGAIYNDGELTVADTTLKENTAEKDGGAIHNNGTINITESTVQENTANSDGVITNCKGIFKFYNCEVLNNKSSNNIINNDDYLEVHNSIFKDNQGIRIFSNHGDESNLGIFNGKFVGNKVNESVFNSGKFCTIEKGIFENNASSNNIINNADLTLNNLKINGDGKTISNEGYILLKNSSPDFLNQIYGNGKVDVQAELIPKEETFDFGSLDEKIHQYNVKKIILDHDICLEKYEMEYYEGGIELDVDDLVIDGNGHIIDGLSKSRIFIITGKNITLKNIKFKNGRSYKNYDNLINRNGGAIKINRCANLIVNNCKFMNNSSEHYGGAIYNNGELVMPESMFTDNTAEYGGAIYNHNGSLTMKESALNENTAQEDGGAIYNNGELTVTDTTLKENTAKEDGGAIYNEGKLTIQYDTINNNESNRGGAIHNNGTINLIESTVLENTAKRGGAICNEGELTVAESILTGNNTQGWFSGGGAIYNEGELTVADTTLKENTAERNGGAIYNDGELTVTDTTLKENTAERDGGAIHNNGTINILESTLQKNRARAYGGAIYNNGELTISDTTLKVNTAEKGGGAISNEVGVLKDRNCSSHIIPNPYTLIEGFPCKSFVKNKININNCQFESNHPDSNNERPAMDGFKGDFMHWRGDLIFVKYIKTRPR